MQTFPPVEIYNETETQIPKLRFLELKNEILGEGFDLQISVLLPQNSKKINKKQRSMDYVPNTLSFKYSEFSGEIILTPEIIESEDYEIDHEILEKYEDKFLYLLVHSLLHLADHEHSEEMELEEETFFSKYRI